MQETTIQFTVNNNERSKTSTRQYQKKNLQKVQSLSKQFQMPIIGLLKVPISGSYTVLK